VRRWFSRRIRAGPCEVPRGKLAVSDLRMLSAARAKLRFYRHHRPLELQWSQGPSWSQYGEDVYLKEYFRGRNPGFYVEVGGFHPFLYSNTYMFYRVGWTGIVVEPNPEMARELRRRRPRDQIREVAISDREGVGKLALMEGKSGLVGATNLHREQAAFDSVPVVRVATAPLSTVLRESHAPARYDFLSVDCEGHDAVALGSSDWEAYRPLIVICEAFGAQGKAELSDLMRNVDYSLITSCGPSLLFEDRRDGADYPPGYHA